MLDPSKFTFEQAVSLLTLPEVKEIDRSVGDALGFRVIPAESASKWHLLAEVSQAGLPVEEVAATLESRKEAIIAFGIRWNRRCSQVDHGEEFDPREGDQQDDSRQRTVVGLSEGAAVTYALYLIYAAIGMKDLTAYLKRRRMPHASKVAMDIINVADAK